MNTKNLYNFGTKGAMRFVLSGFALGGCGGGSGGLTPPAMGPLTLESGLRGHQVVPPVSTNAIGGMTVEVADEQSPIRVAVGTARSDGRDLEGITKIALHYGKVHENGPVLFKMYDSAVGWTPDSGVLTAQKLKPAPQAGINTFADAVRAVRSGDTYMLVSTIRYPNGELRGQIGQDVLVAPLVRSLINPPPSSYAGGRASVRVNYAQQSITVIITITAPAEGLSDVTGIELHYGTYAEGENAPILFRLSGPVQGRFPTTFSKTLTAADLTPAPQKGINTFADVLELLPIADTRPGDQFLLNIRTRQFPNGQLRGGIPAN